MALTSIVSSPSYVYALYDVFFKFCLATIFYETELLYDNLKRHVEQTSETKAKIIDYGFNESESEISLPLNKFTDHYHRLVHLYNNHLRDVYRELIFKVCVNEFLDTERTRNLILKQLNVFGVFLNMDGEKTHKEKQTTTQPFVTWAKDESKRIMKNVLFNN